MRLQHLLAHQTSVVVKNAFPGGVGDSYRHTRSSRICINAFLDPARHEAQSHFLPHETWIDHEAGVKLLGIEHPVAALVAL